jgi:hypothetical protein
MTDTQSDAIPSPADRLAAIKAQRAKLKEQLDEINAEAAEAAELAKAELDLANETALVAATVQYGPIGVKWDAHMTRLGVVLLKRPTDIKYKAFQEDPKFDFDSLEAYVAPCVIHPKAPEFAALYRELPGVLADLVIRLNALMGERRAEQAKK